MNWVAQPRGRAAAPAAGGWRAAAWPMLQDQKADGLAAAAAEAEDIAAPPAILAFDEADLARACAAAATAARAEERAAMAEERETRIGEALAAIAAAFDAVDAVMEERRQQLRTAAATFAASAAETVAPSTPKQLASRLALALVDDCLARLDPDLALTVEVAPELADMLAARLDAAPAIRRRPGRVAVEAVDDLAAGDARLVWADGHAEWSAERLKADAMTMLERLAQPARNPNATTKEPA